MKNKGIIALSLISCLALVGCDLGQNTLPDINSGNNSSDSGNGSSDLKPIEPDKPSSEIENPDHPGFIVNGTNRVANDVNKQNYYDVVRQSLVKETDYRGALKLDVDANISGNIKEAKLDNKVIDATKLGLVGPHAEFNFQIENDLRNKDFDIQVSKTGKDFENVEFSDLTKISVYEYNGKTYGYEYDKDSKYPQYDGEQSYIISDDWLEHEFYQQIKYSVDDFINDEQFKQFKTLESAIQAEINELAKNYNYKINYDFELIDNNFDYFVKLTANGVGKIDISNTTGPNGKEIPLDSIGDAKLTATLEFSKDRIKNIDIKGEAKALGHQIINGKRLDLVYSLEANGNAKLDHNSDPYFDVVANKNLPAEEIVNSVGVSISNLVESQSNYYKSFFGKHIGDKIDIATTFVPSDLKHTHAEVYRDGKLIDINNITCESYEQHIEVKYTVDNGYALVIKNMRNAYNIEDNKLVFEEVKINEGNNSYSFGLPEKIPYEMNTVNYPEGEIQVGNQYFPVHYVLNSSKTEFVIDTMPKIQLQDRQVVFAYITNYIK